jgi:hypothetical protein
MNKRLSMQIQNLLVFLLFMNSLMAEIVEVDVIGRKIWRHECRESVEGLTSWNDGEEFPSLGIGHFIWYAQKDQAPFEETFPALLDFLEQKGASPPLWLREKKECPWRSREEFFEQFESVEMKELRCYLDQTFNLQAQFMVGRLEKAFSRFLIDLPENRKKHVEEQFHRIKSDPVGDYVLVDYLNFKGEGISPKERYLGKGWGLLQVFEEMNNTTSVEPVEEFVRAAKNVLLERIRNSPPERREERWLKGWFYRLETYLIMNIN